MRQGSKRKKNLLGVYRVTHLYCVCTYLQRAHNHNNVGDISEQEAEQELMHRGPDRVPCANTDRRVAPH